MRAIWRLLLLGCLVGSPCCWAASNLELILPLLDDLSGLRALAKKVGAQAEVITTAGERVRLEVAAGPDDALHGVRLDGDGGEVSLPLDSVALVYYSEPSTGRADKQTASKKDRYPLLPNAGEVEAGLGCMQLDTELARAEAVRWSLRLDGAVSSAPVREQNPIQERATVGSVATAAGQAFACATGATGECRIGRAARGVESADQRIAGLLRLKADKSCAGRPTLQSGATDVDVWRQLGLIESLWSGAEAYFWSNTELLAETAAFDLMSPKALPPPPAYEVEWVPEPDFSWRTRRDRAHLNLWTGSAEVADDDLVINLYTHEHDGQRSAEASVVHIPYAAIASTEGIFLGGEPTTVLWGVDGRYPALHVVLEDGAKGEDRFAKQRDLVNAVNLKVAAQGLAAAVESPAAETTFEKAIVTLEGINEVTPTSSVVTFTESDIVFYGPARTFHVPYARLTSAELDEGGTEVILKWSPAPDIRVQLYSNERGSRRDREGMAAFIADLHMRMASALR